MTARVRAIALGGLLGLAAGCATTGPPPPQVAARPECAAVYFADRAPDCPKDWNGVVDVLIFILGIL